MNDAQHFFVIGAMKAGTTSLYHYLAPHPDIYASPVKETKFYSKLTSKRRAQNYESYFKGRKNEKWAFEASPDYTKYPRYPGVPQRLKANFPDASLIYIVRHPVDRIFSHYLFRLASPSGREVHSFEDAVTLNPIYLMTSSYYMQLTQYLGLYPKSRIKVILFEELASDPLATLRDVYNFLDIDTTFEPPNLNRIYNEGNDRTTMVTPVIQRWKQTTWYPYVPWRIRHWARRRFRVPAPKKAEVFTPELYNRLHGLLKDDVARLQDFMGRELPWDFPKSKLA